MTQRSPFPEGLEVGRKTPVDLPPGSPPSFAVDAAHVNIQTILLDDARINEKFEFGASNFIWIIASTSLGANADFRFNSQQNSAIPFRRGQVVRGLGFSTVYISNDAQAGESLTLFVVRESEGNINVENPASNVAEVTFTKATVLDTVADVSCANAAVTQVLPANANRREAIIQNLDLAADVRVGDANVTATRGYRLGAGASIILSTTEAISVRNDSGAAVDVSPMEIAD